MGINLSAMRKEPIRHPHWENIGGTINVSLSMLASSWEGSPPRWSGLVIHDHREQGLINGKAQRFQSERLGRTSIIVFLQGWIDRTNSSRLRGTEWNIRSLIWRGWEPDPWAEGEVLKQILPNNQAMTLPSTGRPSPRPGQFHYPEVAREEADGVICPSMSLEKGTVQRKDNTNRNRQMTDTIIYRRNSVLVIWTYRDSQTGCMDGIGSNNIQGRASAGSVIIH